MSEQRNNALQHYSTVIMDFRKTLVIQGFVLVTAALYLLEKDLPALSLIVSGFGLLFTSVITFQLLNDMQNFRSFTDQITDKNDPWFPYKHKRDRRFKIIGYKLIVVYGPTAIIFLAFFATIYAGNDCLSEPQPSNEKSSQAIRFCGKSNAEKT